MQSQKPKTSSLKPDGGYAQPNALEIPSIQLPKGGGAIKGIDEKFAVNAANGTAAFTFSLPFSPTRTNFPQLSVSYNSGAGNGILGLGWDLDLPSIQRKTDNGLPQYLDDLDSDTFIFSETEDLVPEFQKTRAGQFLTDEEGQFVIRERETADGHFLIRYYRPRIEGLYARIERWTDKTSGVTKWSVTTRENITTRFGWTSQSVVADPTDPRKIFTWLPEFTFDDQGNCCHYIYKKENGQGLNQALLHLKNRHDQNGITYTNCYLEKVCYGNRRPYPRSAETFPPERDYLFQTVFDYGEYRTDAPYDRIKDWNYRADAFSTYRPGFEIRTTRLCQRVLLYHFFDELPGETALVKSTNFTYDTTTQPGITFLRSVQEYGYIKKPDHTYSHKKLPAFEFTYQGFAWNGEVKTIAAADLVHVPAGLEGEQYQFTDLYNEGLSGILTQEDRGWYYKKNLGNGKFEAAKLVGRKPTLSGKGQQLRLVDLDADGTKQLLNLSAGSKGYFELDDDQEWSSYRHFQQLPNINFADPNTRMLDLNGDGKADVLITEERVFTWYTSEGRKGFSKARTTPKPLDEEAGPHILFADPRQTIFLADMSGDGLTDIVRIRNGEVCYWPNLGYGRFGRKTGMDQSPLFDHQDAFNPAFIHLADIDGSGTTDIIYLGKNKFSCWINLNGNAFQPVPFEITAFPDLHRQAKVRVMDILGNGTTCIVWSGMLFKDQHAPLRYIDLMNGKKPHLLVAYKNNFGKEVRLEYTPSTSFYMADRQAGKPWVTKLQFPVHCVSRTETLDRVSGRRLIRSYKYHHGYYDHSEREFRGFGMVEQIDSESFENWEKGSHTNIVDRELHQGPVVSKIWYHTGAFLRQQKIFDQFADDHWYEELRRRGGAVPAAMLYEKPLPEANIVCSPGLTKENTELLSAHEWREALRACKSKTLRSEVFARDAPPANPAPEDLRKQLIPYTVDTHHYTIDRVQPKGNNKHAVFVVRESESLHYQYDRDVADPRIKHELNMAFDRFGNVLESATVRYPRLQTDATLPVVTQKAQAKLTVTYTQNRFTNDVVNDETYRLPMLAETRIFDLKGLNKHGFFYTPEDFTEVLTRARKIPYHEREREPGPESIQSTLIRHRRNLFYRNDLTGAMALGKLESRALPYNSYELAYTPDLLEAIFGDKVQDRHLTEGHFIHSEGDRNWWIGTGGREYKTENETAEDAARRFFRPVAYTDPAGAKTRVQYYGDYFLLVDTTEDPLGNIAQIDRFNFRTLQARRMRDINNNLSEVISDELGLVKATAVYGKGEEADDLTGLSDFTDTDETARCAAFFQPPETAEGVTDAEALRTLAGQLLQRATNRYVYQLEAYDRNGQPPAVAAITREQHFRSDQPGRLQISYEYSDGSGEVVMKKIPADAGPAQKVTVRADHSYSVEQIDTARLDRPQLRWIGSGRLIVNNKGNPVRQYEPYFSVNPRYEQVRELVETGVSPVMYYDAVGRLVKTVMPDETFTRMESSPWQQRLFDAVDTLRESSWYEKRSNRRIDAELLAAGKDPLQEKAAADQAVPLAGTPRVQHLDNQGRIVLTTEHNRDAGTGTDEYYRTKFQLDTAGCLLRITDARELPENEFLGNPTMHYQYDMLGNQVYQHSADAGRRWLLLNAAEHPLYTWDERGHECQFSYDLRQRLTHSKVTGGDGAVPLDHIFERIVYAEDLLLPDRSNITELQTANSLGRPVRHFDTAGVILTPEYNFKGEPLSTTRRLFRHYKSVANWTDAHLETDLEAESFTLRTETDALGRITRETAPDGSTTVIAYNEAGLPASQTVAHEPSDAGHPYIDRIEYNERGQRSRIRYGNGVITKYHYDRLTFRLQRLESRRQNQECLHDWQYTYDPVGNITHIEDRHSPAEFHKQEKISGVAHYNYDALYRLVEAGGRESPATLDFGPADHWHDRSFSSDLPPGNQLKLRNYTQRYRYDCVGNILEMKHRAAGGSWTRSYTYESDSNRLQSTRVGQHGRVVDYRRYPHHTAHGFLEALPHLREIGWNFREEMISSSRQHAGEGHRPETTYYQYDHLGKRIRKITENQAITETTPSRKEERIYVAGYETYRHYRADTISFERESLSLRDEDHRFALVETIRKNDQHRPAPTERAGTRRVRYQLGNHQSSTSLELDGTVEARVISYEEFHPFGTTAYLLTNASVRAAAKRYRYTGAERDEESGLAYHGTRYYLPWLGRWLSCDPLYQLTAVRRRSLPDGHPPGVTANAKTEEQRPEGKRDATAQSVAKREKHALEGPSAAAAKSGSEAPALERDIKKQAIDPRLYQYVFNNPVNYSDPSGQVPILQEYSEALDNSSGAGTFFLAILSPLVWAIHVLINLVFLAISAVIQPFSPWDFSFGGIATAVGLLIGSVFILLGGHVGGDFGKTARVNMPEYMGNPGAFSLGPVIVGGHGFSDWQHEYGHTWQNRVLGPFYLLVIAVPSLFSAGIDPASHHDFYTESWADSWSDWLYYEGL